MAKITSKQFLEYWLSKGQYLSINNSNRLKDNLIKKIEELGDSILLDEYVSGLRTGKESIRQVVVDFYNFINKQNNCNSIDSGLFNKQYYNYPFERQLEIAKFLHEPKTPSEIRNRFDIDERTMRKDLQELEEGVKVLGTTIRIEKEKKGRSYYYKSTLHPVFLPLNLTEVYALTVYLDHVLNNFDPNAQMIHNISKRIKCQLSDYAYNKLFPDENRQDYYNFYMSDEELANQRQGIYMYLMKTGMNCKFLWKDKEYLGHIVFDNNKYRICLSDNKLLEAELSEVDFIVDKLDYK